MKFGQAHGGGLQQRGSLAPSGFNACSTPSLSTYWITPEQPGVWSYRRIAIIQQLIGGRMFPAEHSKTWKGPCDC